MHDFTPLPALIGGLLIGLAVSLLWLTHGRVAGVSGLYASLLGRNVGTRRLELGFVVGLLVSGALAMVFLPSALPTAPVRPLGLTVLAGLLVGFGTRLGNGCTSGHGVCGISRFSARSMVATVTFMLTGGLTVLALRLLLGDTP